MEPVNFVAASEEIFNIWTDGINALLGKRVSSLRTVHFVDIPTHTHSRLTAVDLGLPG